VIKLYNRKLEESQPLVGLCTRSDSTNGSPSEVDRWQWCVQSLWTKLQQYTGETTYLLF